MPEKFEKRLKAERLAKLRSIGFLFVKVLHDISTMRLELIHFKHPILSLLLVIVSSYLQSVASNRLYWRKIWYPKMLPKVRSLRTSRFRLPTLKLSHWQLNSSIFYLGICTTPSEKKSSRVWMIFQLESGSFETTPTSYPLPHPSELQHLAPEKFTTWKGKENVLSCKHPTFHRKQRLC